MKDNVQLAEFDPVGRKLGAAILDALMERNLRFRRSALEGVCRLCSTAMPGGNPDGAHIDGAVRLVGSAGHRLRTDLSATLF